MKMSPPGPYGPRGLLAIFYQELRLCISWRVFLISTVRRSIGHHLKHGDDLCLLDHPESAGRTINSIDF